MEKGLIIETQPLDVYGQMAADEALCEAMPAPYLLRFYNWRAPGVTFGYSQRRRQVQQALDAAGCAIADVQSRVESVIENGLATMDDFTARLIRGEWPVC